MYRNPCRYCGANLDPGETCDCMKDEREELSLSDIKSSEYGVDTSYIYPNKEKIPD